MTKGTIVNEDWQEILTRSDCTDAELRILQLTLMQVKGSLRGRPNLTLENGIIRAIRRRADLPLQPDESLIDHLAAEIGDVAKQTKLRAKAQKPSDSIESAPPAQAQESTLSRAIPMYPPTPAASPQPSKPSEDAKSLLEAGQRALKEGRLEECLPKFEALLRLQMATEAPRRNETETRVAAIRIAISAQNDRFEEDRLYKKDTRLLLEAVAVLERAKLFKTAFKLIKLAAKQDESNTLAKRKKAELASILGFEKSVRPYAEPISLHHRPFPVPPPAKESPDTDPETNQPDLQVPTPAPIETESLPPTEQLRLAIKNWLKDTVKDLLPPEHIGSKKHQVKQEPAREITIPNDQIKDDLIRAIEGFRTHPAFEGLVIELPQHIGSLQGMLRKLSAKVEARVFPLEASRQITNLLDAIDG